MPTIAVTVESTSVPAEVAENPTATPQPATATDTAVPPTAAPSETPVPPATPTPLAVGTATAAATAAATAGPSPTPRPTIEGMIGPDDFPENVNPLTGETVRDPAVLDRRPMAIKVSNYPPSIRPQAGLNNADLVFEHYVDWGFTRFTAVFYSQDAKKVGPVRSGRIIDLEIPMMYDAAFGYSGSAGRIRLMFQESPFFDRIISPDFAHGGFYRFPGEDKPLEHTLFTDTDGLRFILGERGQNVRPVFANHMAFREEPLTEGEPVDLLQVGYRNTNATWDYSNDGRYYRWTDGERHMDANTGEQLSFKNIIVLAANHQPTDIVEASSGYQPSLQIQIWGEGPVSIFRDGQRFDGRWRREDPSHMLTFYDLEGNILPLAPGNSFFQLVPLGFDRLYVEP